MLWGQCTDPAALAAVYYNCITCLCWIFCIKEVEFVLPFPSLHCNTDAFACASTFLPLSLLLVRVGPVVQTRVLPFSIALPPMSELPPVSFQLLNVSLTYVKWIKSCLEKTKVCSFSIRITTTTRQKTPQTRYFSVAVSIIPTARPLQRYCCFHPATHFSWAGCQAHRKEGEGETVMVLTRIPTE